MRISLWNSSLVKTQPIHFVLVPKSSRNFDLDTIQQSTFENSMFLWKHKVKSSSCHTFFSHIFQVLHLQSVSIFLGYPYKILVPFSVNCFVIPLSTLRLKRNRNNHFSDLNAKYIFSFVQPSCSFPQTTTSYAEFRSVRFIGLPSQNMPKRVSRLNNPWSCRR